MIDDYETDSGISDDTSNSNSDTGANRLLDDDPWTTPMESEQMSKARTFYIYKNLEVLQRAFEEQEPISGVVVLCEGHPELFVVHRNGRNQFGWKMIGFNDEMGIDVFGMWYAPMKMSDTLHAPPSSLQVLTEWAKMAAVAIPLRFGVEGKHMMEHQTKFCVITNWWRERICGGDYSFPQLVWSRYEEGEDSGAGATG
jgi:hypothetical protein